MATDLQTPGEAHTKGWLFVVPWSLDAVGGVSEVVKNLIAQAKVSGGYVPRLMINGWDRNDAETNDSHSSIHLRLREPGTHWGDCKVNLAFFVHLIPTLIRLRRSLRRQAVSVVNIHYPNSTCVYFAIARRLKWIDALILSFHGLDIAAFHSRRDLQTRIARWSVSASDSVVACSKHLAAEATASIGLAPDRISVVHNGLDPERCRAATAVIDDEPRSAMTIVCVATLEHKKGIDTLLSAFERLGVRHPSCRLVIVGRCTAYTPTLVGQLADLRSRLPAVGSRVRLIEGEPHGTVLQRIRTATVLVLPSRSEPFGIVLLEAGFMGTPVVASRVGGIPEIIDDKTHGLLFPVGDAKGLADAVQRILLDPSLRASLSANLQQRVLNVFTWSVAWDKYRMLTVKAPAMLEAVVAEPSAA